MRTLAFPLALLLVVAAPIVAVGALTAAGHWGRWLVRTGGLLGLAGLMVTAVASVNLFVPRTCSSTTTPEHNRPVISLVLGHDGCFRSAVAQLQVAALTGLTASLAVQAVSIRRRRWSARRSFPVSPPHTPSNSRESTA
ncbi:MAG: hypothetical protein JWN29_2682 [Acidimicrobiales bacterium]|nr:hypothetical protein [Acidimicrobiales bacterium]